MKKILVLIVGPILTLIAILLLAKFGKNQNINNNPVTTPTDTITTITMTCCPVDGTYVDTVTQLPK